MVSEQPSDALPPGTRLRDGALVVAGILGQGGFGTTYRALDTVLRREVALKELFPLGCARQGTDVVPAGVWTEEAWQDARTRFLQECRTLATFDHPGIVPVFSHFEENNTAYMTMDLVRGETLAALVGRGGPLPQAQAVRFTEQIADALDRVHAAGVLHRDVNPSNVMLADGERCVLIDFGTAREWVQGVTQQQSMILTPGFAPLEQYAQRAARGPFSDVYALGATLYFMLTGRQPTAATERAAGGPLPAVRSLRPDVSEETALAVERALEMAPHARPQSAAELVETLRAGPTSSTERTPALASSPARLVCLMGVALMAVGALAPVAVHDARAGRAAHWEGAFSLLDLGGVAYVIFLVLALSLAASARWSALSRLSAAQVPLLLYLGTTVVAPSTSCWGPAALGCLLLLTGAMMGERSAPAPPRKRKFWQLLTLVGAGVGVATVTLVSLFPTNITTQLIGRWPINPTALDILHMKVLAFGAILMTAVGAAEAADAEEPFLVLACGLLASGMAVMVKMRFGWRPFFGWPVPVVWEPLTLLLLAGGGALVVGGLMGRAARPDADGAAALRAWLEDVKGGLRSLWPTSTSSERMAVGLAAVAAAMWVAGCWKK